MLTSVTLGYAPPPPEPIPAELFRPVLTTLAPRVTLTPETPVVTDSEALSPPQRPTSRPLVEHPEPRVEEILTHRLSGQASWYCKAGRSPCHYQYPDGPGRDLYAAAGPRLRAAICGSQACTSWRGRTVRVDGVPIRLIDWCQCFRNEAHEKVIDLYWDAWVATGGGSVTIRW